MHFPLPPFINADGLYPFLELLADSQDEPEIDLDFSKLVRVSPAGLVSLAAWVNHRNNKNKITIPSKYENCSITGYLQRMNLPEICNWNWGFESFSRRSELGRFVALQQIDQRVEDLGQKFASCIAPGGEDYDHPNAGLYDAAWYLITEMANNVRQHSQGQGFVAAQTTKRDGFIRIAIADCGQGITASFRNAGLEWAQETSDQMCIAKALEARISSKGQPSNEGVGLTLSARVANLMGGHIMICSSKGVVISNPKGKRFSKPDLSSPGFPGTLITIAFSSTAAAHFDHRLHEAKNSEGLLQGGRYSGMFSS